MSKIARTDVIIGVDTHKEVHSAVAIDALGVRLADNTLATNSKGYRALETWAASLGPIGAIGVKGTCAYGASLSHFLRERGYAVLEVNRPNRQMRRQHGKSDPVDAENAARSVLSGQATAQPKSGAGTVEMCQATG